MGKIGSNKLQTFCVNRIRPLVKVPIQNKLGSTSPNCAKENDQDNNQVEEENNSKFEENSEKLRANDAGRNIMVVVDSSVEAKVALQWAFTHTVQKKEDTRKKMSPKVYELLHSMKKTCRSGGENGRR
ncbi:Importin-8 [Bienertia sinuspersici]